MSDMRKSRPQAGKVHSRAPSKPITKLQAAADVAAMFGQSYKGPRAGETPTTMPKHVHTGGYINEDRRRKRKIKQAYREKHGRRMNAKAWKRDRRARKEEG